MGSASALAFSICAGLSAGLCALNIWLYEGVLGHALIMLYGHNVAYCYDDYADAFCNGCCRLGHGVFWLGLGAACLALEAPLERAAAAVADGALW